MYVLFGPSTNVNAESLTHCGRCSESEGEWGGKASLGGQVGARFRGREELPRNATGPVSSKGLEPEESLVLVFQIQLFIAVPGG